MLTREIVDLWGVPKHTRESVKKYRKICNSQRARQRGEPLHVKVTTVIRFMKQQSPLHDTVEWQTKVDRMPVNL